MNSNNHLWKCSEETAKASNLAAFLTNHRLSSYQNLVSKADGDVAWFWDAIFDFFKIEFAQPYSKTVDLSAGIEWPKWCIGGTTNISLNCLDRHRGTPIWTKPAVIGEDEKGNTRTWTYEELDGKVNQLAEILRGRKIEPGDVVALYLPMIPEAAAAFLAIVKIGAVALPLFSGFGPSPIRQRLEHSGARAIITVEHMRRRGQPIALKATLDAALEDNAAVHTVVVVQRGDTAEFSAGTHRDVPWASESPTPSGACPTEIVAAEAPAMLMYTSGTTGQPKGTVHTHCGMLGKNALDMGLCIDIKSSDTLLWMSDMGWIVGPKIVMSSTLLGATLVMAEGTPDWPNPNRLWEVAAKHGVTVVGIVPTAVRQMMRYGPNIAAEYDLSRLRVTLSAGEMWNEEAWLWFFENICKRRIPILNYAGGTECGGAILIGNLLAPLRPGAFGGPVPGCGADVVSRDGKSLPPSEIGELVMRAPTIGMSRGLWKDPDRYLENYWKVIPGMWVQGDLASRDEHGLWYLHGRSDDVIKLAGKRTDPAEIEAAAMESGLVTDALIVGIDDPISGSALICVCVLKQPGLELDVETRIAQFIATRCGSPYRPKRILFTNDLPRTINGKIMRRIVRSIVSGHPVGDISSVGNPDSIAQIQAAVAASDSRMRTPILQ